MNGLLSMKNYCQKSSNIFDYTREDAKFAAKFKLNKCNEIK